MDDLKEAAKEIVQPARAAAKRARLTHSLFFDDDRGFGGDCSAHACGALEPCNGHTLDRVAKQRQAATKHDKKCPKIVLAGGCGFFLRCGCFFVQKRPFVRNSVCSQCLEGLFAILAECSQFCLRSFLSIENFKSKSITLLVGKGGVQGRENCEQQFCEQTGVSFLFSDISSTSGHGFLFQGCPTICPLQLEPVLGTIMRNNKRDENPPDSGKFGLNF